jgi:hypothetical protein
VAGENFLYSLNGARLRERRARLTGALSSGRLPRALGRALDCSEHILPLDETLDALGIETILARCLPMPRRTPAVVVRLAGGPDCRLDPAGQGLFTAEPDHPVAPDLAGVQGSGAPACVTGSKFLPCRRVPSMKAYRAGSAKTDVISSAGSGSRGSRVSRSVLASPRRWSCSPASWCCQVLERRDYLRTRNRRMVTAPDRVLLIGSRSILVRPGGEKRMPSPSSTGSTYTRISSTSPRRRH